MFENFLIETMKKIILSDVILRMRFCWGMTISNMTHNWTFILTNKALMYSEICKFSHS